MKITRSFKRFLIETFLGIYSITNILPIPYIYAATTSSKIVSPLKTVSKLECRFQDFDDLSSDCIQTLPTIKSKDYEKYAIKDGGYNDFTRYYTVLWGASYKYGWDVGYGGHEGIDIATSKGTPVLAIADGKVINAKLDLAWGNFITIEHEIRGKKVFSNYAHLSKLDVIIGDKVNVGDKIGEVGSTGNSTGNHLHFQIDLDTAFHPYYPDYKSCPYSYYDITENGVCLNQIQKNTIDPIIFLETEGAVLDDVDVSTSKVSRITIDDSNTKSDSSVVSSDFEDRNSTTTLDIFNKTVYIGYDVSDIKKVQEVFTDIGEYNGLISGDYADIEQTIISYQLSNNIISSKDDYGAGRFGPKTREQVEHDYKNFLANGGKIKNPSKTVSETGVNNVTINQKVSRTNMLTREEIEERELKEFLKYYNIDLKLTNIGGNIETGKSIKLNIEIYSKSKHKAFKGNTPLDITFDINESNVSVFPKKIYNFTDGIRDVTLTGEKEGTTTLKVKMGTIVIDSFPIRVTGVGQVIYPKTALVIADSSIVIGETKKGIGIMQDSSNKKLINVKYGSTFILRGTGDAQVCLKNGSMNNIKNIYKKDCKDEDFKKELTFSYDDTVGGVILFDYKSAGKESKIEIVNNYNNSLMVSKSIKVSSPKGLSKLYVYYDEVNELLKEDVVGGIKKGYFLQDRGLVEADALDWIKNTLLKLDENTGDPSMKKEIANRLIILNKENVSRFDTISRVDFLDYAYKYLAFDDMNLDLTKEYRDLDIAGNKKVAVAFDENTTWKDQFGASYFRPNMGLTRGEGAYFLKQVLTKQRKLYLVNR